MELSIQFNGGKVQVNGRELIITTKVFKEKINIFNLDTDKIILKKSKIYGKFNSLGGILDIECIKLGKVYRYNMIYKKEFCRDVLILKELISNSSLPKGIIATVQGRTDSIELFDNKIVIKRKQKFMSVHNSSGDKEIFLSSIKAVQFFAPNNIQDGYIQFSILGGVESGKRDLISGAFSSPLLDAMYDENSVVFKGKQVESFRKIKDLILSEIDKRETQRNNNVITIKQNIDGNKIDEIEYIKKLAELRDRSIITEEEFSAKKKKVLGI